MARVRSLSLRVKLSLGLVFIVGAVFVASHLISMYRQQAAREADATTGARAARILAGSLTSHLGTFDLDHPSTQTLLENAVTNAMEINPNLAWVVVTDDSGHVLIGKARSELIPTRSDQEDEASIVADVVQGGGKLRGVLGSELHTARIKVNPPRSGPAPTLYVGTSFRHLHERWRRERVESVVLLGAVLLCLVVYASFALGRLVLRPLGVIGAAMQRVREGNLDVSVPVQANDEIGRLALTHNLMLAGLKERDRLKDAFSRYVSKQVYEKLQAKELTLSGETRNVTVLFSDIRSFTTLSEQATAEEVVALLNEYFNDMVEIVIKYDGFLNKFIGDAVMAIYNAPLDQDRPELRAVYTAYDMMKALKALNVRREARGTFPLKIGIGINTGPAVAGNIGHAQRLEYTVIGDTVNLAQRIESQTKVAGASILISESTFQAVRDFVRVKELPPVHVKGKAQPVQLYAVVGLGAQEGATPPPAISMLG